MKKEEKHRRYLDDNHLCWTDGDGALHIDAVKACEHFGYAPTPENQDAMVQGLMKAGKELLPAARVAIVEDKPSDRCDHKFLGTRACVKCGWEPDFQGGPMGGA